MKKLRITVNGISYDVEVEVLEDDTEDGYGYSATQMSHMPPSPAISSSTTTPSTAPPKPTTPSPTAAGDSKTLTSPVPGVVREVKVNAGDSVEELTPLLVIETMKMDTIVSSPVAGVIKEIKVQANQDVQQGQVLVTFE
jgi:biotin carboxyl carrier protein